MAAGDRLRPGVQPEKLELVGHVARQVW